MNKLFLIVTFCIMVVAQWFVPAQMIYQQEAVLTEGTAYKFKTRPVDPNDPLRGKYVELNYSMRRVSSVIEDLTYGDQLYVYIIEDEDGFAKATHASATKEVTDQDYVLATVKYLHENGVSFDLPFNKFYMEESKAYPAEVLIRNAMRDGIIDNCYSLVYVKDGEAVLNDVIINDTSLKDYVEQHQKENTED